MHRLRVLPDTRTASERREAVESIRRTPELRNLLAETVAKFRIALDRIEPYKSPADSWWDLLDAGYNALDRYLRREMTDAELDVRCKAGCSACCTDVPPTFAIEGLRLVRTLQGRMDTASRIRRAIDYARKFQQMLQAGVGPTSASMDIASDRYRRVQMAWRAMGYPCPLLGDDGSCTVYDVRPLACRVHVHIEDPASCEPSHARFADVERVPIWSDPSEAEVEQLLIAIGDALGLPRTPNLPWAIAKLHDHPWRTMD